MFGLFFEEDINIGEKGIFFLDNIRILRYSNIQRWFCLEKKEVGGV